jgi:hypothetical protein
VLVRGHTLEVVGQTVREALKEHGGLESIGRAFRDGDPDGNPSLQAVIHDVGVAVVASAVYGQLAARGGGGEAGLVDPNCSGTSFETIPTPLTPIVHDGRDVHRVSELPQLRKQLAIAVERLDKIAASHAPTGADVGVVREQLEGALKGLGR